MKCANCGSEQSVHGDCLVCNSPLAAPRSYSAAVALAEDASDSPAVISALLDRLPAAAIEDHLQQMPTSYLRHTTAEEVGNHIALITRANGGTAIEHSVSRDVDQITIATSDRPGILVALAGVLAGHGVNIIGGSAHTRTDGVAVDVMFVDPPVEHPDDAWWAQVCGDIGLALAGNYPLEQRLTAMRAHMPRRASTIPTSVYVDSDFTGMYTKIEVNAVDRIGLLYTITRTLREMDIRIHLAIVETEGTMGVDTFYVRRADGSRIDDPESMRMVGDTLRAAVATLD